MMVARKMETKVLKIYLKTWRKLRRQIKGRKNETMADYMDRVIKRVDDCKVYMERLEYYK